METNANVLPEDTSIDQMGDFLEGGSGAPPVMPAVAPPPAAPVVPPEGTPAKPPEAEAKPVIAAEPGAGEQAHEPPAEPADAQQAKPPKEAWWDKRIRRESAKRHEAEATARAEQRRADDEHARALRLERELEALKTGQPGPGQQTEAPAGTPPAAARPNQPGQFDKPKPTMKDFTTPGGGNYVDGEDFDDTVQRFQETYADWRDQKRQFETNLEAVSRSEQVQKEAFFGDIRSAMEADNDWEDARDYVLGNTPEGLQVAISQLPRYSKEEASWTKVVSHLAENPDQLASLVEQWGENPFGATVELGRIMDSLKPVGAPVRSAAAAEPVPATPAPRAAPKPPAVVGGATAPGPVNIEDPTLSMDAFVNEVSKFLTSPRR